MEKILYTITDEAPALATYSLLPILQSYTKGSGISFEKKDISLSGRIIANFPENLTENQQIPDFLDELGKLTKLAETNIIKLPNISASIPQLKAAVKELQDKGYNIPNYPEDPKTRKGKKLHTRFATVLGSAVNPVLREGNSDRRAAASVKLFGKKNPHNFMKQWPEQSQSRVAHMSKGDFYGSEKSVSVKKACNVRIEFISDDKNKGDGNQTILTDKISLLKDEIIDSSVMAVRALRKFYADQTKNAKKDGVLLSLHIKTPMMKVSDPIMFGHCVDVFYKDVFTKHAKVIKEMGVDVNNG
nr:NADP-dependent isocitrate dehydrogenase [Desulfobacula sp.]